MVKYKSENVQGGCAMNFNPKILEEDAKISGPMTIIGLVVILIMGGIVLCLNG